MVFDFLLMFLLFVHFDGRFRRIAPDDPHVQYAQIDVSGNLEGLFVQRWAVNFVIVDLLTPAVPQLVSQDLDGLFVKRWAVNFVMVDLLSPAVPQLASQAVRHETTRRYLFAARLGVEPSQAMLNNLVTMGWAKCWHWLPQHLQEVSGQWHVWIPYADKVFICSFCGVMHGCGRVLPSQICSGRQAGRLCKLRVLLTVADQSFPREDLCRFCRRACAVVQC